jgi:hypothetical protein
MVQRAFVFYWAHSHLLSLVVLILAICFRGPIRRFVGSFGSAPKVVGTFDKAVIALAIGHAVFYLSVPNFADYGEPVIPLLAANYLHGEPIYADWSLGQAIVGSNYGPYTFMLQLPVLLWSPSIAASKLVGVCFGFASLLLLFFAVRGKGGTTSQALAVCALAICLLSFELHRWFWNRPDSVLIATVSLSALLFDRIPPMACLVVIGLLAGAALNLKLFGAVYLLPFAIGCAVQTHSWPRLAGAVVLGGALFLMAALIPFIAEVSSVKAYFTNILLMPNQGLDVGEIAESLFYGLTILLMPLLAWRTSGAAGADRATAFVLVACTILIAIVSGKPGGGPTYMMPFVPTALYLTVRISRQVTNLDRLEISESLQLATFAVFICAAPLWAYSWYQIAKQVPHYEEERAKEMELRAIFKANPQYEMGSNSGPHPQEDEFYRVEKAFLGQTTRFDYVNLSDQRQAGLPASVVYPLFEACRIPGWVFTRHGDRFGGRVYEVPILDAEGLERFYSNYELSEQTRFFEIWRCRKRQGNIGEKIRVGGRDQGRIETVAPFANSSWK